MSKPNDETYSNNHGAPAELPALGQHQQPPSSSSGMRRGAAPGSGGVLVSKAGGGSNNSNQSIMPTASNVSIGTSTSQQHQHLSVERSPMPPMILRSLGDRSNEKRKNAALEIEALVKTLQEANNSLMIQNVIEILSKDFCTSMNSNYRKGGLVGLAATGIGLMGHSRTFLPVLLPPVLHCFDDPESRVRYYACESLYNIAKVSRQGILQYFNQIFEGLTKVIADVDVDVKNGAQLLDRLIKDIVTEADEAFQVDQFLPLLQKYIQRTNPYIRQLIVGWVTLLDSVPDISMLDYLPDFLDGLFNMLSDSNREIRQAADSALSEFLKELTSSTVMEFGPIISILVLQCQSKERLNRLTATTWLSELIHHPYSGGDALLPYNSEILGAILCCISDGEVEIRIVAERTNDDLLSLVKGTSSPFELRSLLETLTSELLNKEDVPTKMAALGWINMLMEKRKGDMNAFIEELLPVLIRTLSDPSDAVVLLNLQVLSRISLAQRDEKGDAEESAEEQFELVLNAILSLFAKDRQLLETRGSLIIRKLCVLLNAKSVYIRLANALMQYEKVNEKIADAGTLEFVSTMVQTLNLILLTASELHDLRSILSKSFTIPPENDSKKNNPEHDQRKRPQKQKQKQWSRQKKNFIEDSLKVFVILFRCWSHNPVATFSLCLLAQAYDLSFALVKRFSKMEDVSVGFLMQIDKLVYLLESPIFVHLRLKLLDVESESHAQLLKSIYGILLCLPQGDAFRLLNNRLTTVCNLRDNLGLTPMPDAPKQDDLSLPSTSTVFVGCFPLSLDALLIRYDEILEMHRVAQEQYDNFVYDEQQRLQMQLAPGSQQIGLSGSSQGGRSHQAVLAHGPLSPQYQQHERRLWD
ncbi:unnamed protein product [Pseudo-nitzschia multistriata]|uniref:Vacuolar protein 14 C-terminal Fig4-binding domain-containing protein n=1 Tax=Pseudo-nitzschia multistriata TaxID=183589 RepID=A0A448ZKT3_9STRA|nr:unnamed protein product [Pseudo-nitzschia multistriata]